MVDINRIERALSDNLWHKKGEFGPNKSWLINGAGATMPLAESDSGRYICIPGDKTPTLAPDGA